MVCFVTTSTAKSDDTHKMKKTKQPREIQDKSNASCPRNYIQYALSYRKSLTSKPATTKFEFAFTDSPFFKFRLTQSTNKYIIVINMFENTHEDEKLRGENN